MRKIVNVSWQKADGPLSPPASLAQLPTREKTSHYDNSKAVYFVMNAYLVLLTPIVQDSALQGLRSQHSEILRLFFLGVKDTGGPLGGRLYLPCLPLFRPSRPVSSSIFQLGDKYLNSYVY